MAIPTCDRPRTLRLAIDSHIAMLQRAGRAVDITVYDDSRSADVGPIVGRSLDGHSARLSTRRSRRKLVDALVVDGFDRDIVSFGLLGPADLPTIGANRNAIQLDALGGVVLSADDDQRAEFSRTPCARTEVCRGSTVSPLQYWPLDGGLERIEDPLRPVEEFLGYDGVVRVVALGVAGDCGLGGSLFALTQRGASRDRLMLGGGYRERRRDRQMIRAVDTSTITPGGFLMAGCIAIDGEAALPPFFPFGRNEDGLWGSLLGAIYPEVSVGHLPMVMRHDPPTTRSFSEQDMTYRGPRVCDILRTAAHQWRSARTASTATPDAFARALIELGRLTDEQLGAWLAHVWWTLMNDVAHRMHRLLEDHDRQPAAWARDVDEFLESLSRQRARNPVPVPVDVPGDRGARLRFTREAVGSYGALLLQWPAICGAAVRLRERGVQAALPCAGGASEVRDRRRSGRVGSVDEGLPPR